MGNKAAAAFKALGDPVRLRLFYLLSRHDELCVCHLTDALQLPQSTVSRHLGLLRHAELASTRREGKWMYYRLNGEIADSLAVLIEPIADTTQQEDLQQLENILQGLNPPCATM
ncbi:MAG: metalloregulator ArsR/SmtB family transcription factor [Mariprofundaceae bacterium]|nr:metalloregulator ArsR/SmtB family transcription factor [Mariprofundaceae bacterium]